MARINQYTALGLSPDQVFLADPDNSWFMKGVSALPQFMPSSPLSARPLLITLALFIPIALVVIQLAPSINSDQWTQLAIIAAVVLVIIAFVVIDRVRTPIQLVSAWPKMSLIVGTVVGCTAVRGETGGYPSYRVTLNYRYQWPDQDAVPIDARLTAIRNDLDGKPLPTAGMVVIVVHFSKPIQTDWFSRRQDFIL